MPRLFFLPCFCSIFLRSQSIRETETFVNYVKMECSRKASASSSANIDLKYILGTRTRLLSTSNGVQILPKVAELGLLGWYNRLLKMTAVGVLLRDTYHF